MECYYQMVQDMNFEFQISTCREIEKSVFEEEIWYEKNSESCLYCSGNNC